MMTRMKKIGDCFILVAEYLTVWKELQKQYKRTFKGLSYSMVLCKSLILVLTKLVDQRHYRSKGR